MKIPNHIASGELVKVSRMMGGNDVFLPRGVGPASMYPP